jgi:hypothetical protein
VRIFRPVAVAFLLRRVLRSLSGIEAHLAQQNQILLRLTDHLAPRVPSDDLGAGSVDFLNPTDIILADAFAAQVQAEQGRPPTEAEILRYLDAEAPTRIYES